MITSGEKYEIEITDMGHDGEGIGKVEGLAVFVTGAITGDLVLAEITELKKNFATAKVEEIIKPSKSRITPLCKQAGICGGCTLGFMNYEGQLVQKRKMIEDSLNRIAGIKDITVKKTMGMKDPMHYRNNGQFPVGTRNGEPIVGFYKAKSHQVIDFENCILQSEPAAVVVNTLKAYLKADKVSVYDEKTAKGTFRHLIVRTADGSGEVMIILVLNGDKLSNIEKLVSMLKKSIDEMKPDKDSGKKWKLRSIIFNVNRRRGPSVMGDKNITIYGSDRIMDVVGDIEYQISPASFYQVNTRQMKRLYNMVMEYANLSGEETVFDLYSGVGTISLYLAKRAKKIIGIESVKTSVEDANRNAIHNEIVNAIFVCGKAEYTLPTMVEEGERADVVILDPPRGGCDERLLEAVVNAEAKRIVYVSCNPATLARDIKYLVGQGYALKEVQPVDMFPWTTNIEAVALLTK